MENESNQEDNAAVISKSASTFTGPCSLSWLLIRNDHVAAAKHGRYTIIHAMQVTSHAPNDIYVGTIVNFNIRDDKVTGEVLSGADEMHLVNDDMKEWVEMDRASNYLLVQYRPAPDHLVHRILSQGDVTPVTLGESKISNKDVFVRDGTKMCQALVLTKNFSLDAIENELCKLKTKANEAIRTSFIHNTPLEDATKDPDDNLWVLLQYSYTLSDCIYTIVRYSDTENPPSNMYPSVQTYLNLNLTMIQAMILHKSQNPLDLMKAMNMLANSCQISIYPQSRDLDFRNADLVKYEHPNLHPRPTYTFGKVSKSDIAKCGMVKKLIEKEAIVIYELLERMETTEEEMDRVLRQLTRLRHRVGI
ncbi:early boundary activity protein 3 isoform X1 [Anastrepha ludens]|uniref:early boundary activity protein 3 isoform X1 n=2 Tax=Anastrepha ludens TaxID=28586 RepID=UPI0023AF3143|nr:early boundary activity protein 3 isoform X1 [Anastrepha ludens]